MDIDDGASRRSRREGTNYGQDKPEQKRGVRSQHEQGAFEGNSASTFCRYCGNDQRDEETPYVDRAHFQVLVACASCGHAFAALSRN